MQAWEIIVITAAAVAVVAAFIALGYFIILPKIIVKKIRGGKENLKFPENFSEVAEKITVMRDLTYVSAFPKNKYDLYLPKNGESKGLVVWLHGGFFIAGDKIGVENVCATIASRGYHVAAINYAVAPENKYPDAIKQTDEAVKHILEAHAQLKGKKTVIAGDSAGGNIAVQYAALATNDALKKEMKINPVLERGDLKGAVLVCAPIDVAELKGVNKFLDKLLPIFGRAYYGKGKWYGCDKFKSTRVYEFIDGDFPPAFITDGNNVSFENQNKKLVKLLNNYGVYNEGVFFNEEEYGKVNHEYLFDLTCKPAPEALEKLINFLDRVLTD